MLRHMLKSKIHRATITGADLDYEGSLSLGPGLREAADLLPGEKVLVVNITNGARFETYIMEGGSGEVCLNGAAARLGHRGDKVIIMSYCLLEEAAARAHQPVRVLVDENNAVRRTTH